MEIKYNKKKVAVIIQARENSLRFPGKVLKKISNKTIIEIIVLRLKKCKTLNDIIVAIPENTQNKNLAKILKKKK